MHDLVDVVLQHRHVHLVAVRLLVHLALRVRAPAVSGELDVEGRLRAERRLDEGRAVGREGVEHGHGARSGLVPLQ